MLLCNSQLKVMLLSFTGKIFKRSFTDVEFHIIIQTPILHGVSITLLIKSEKFNWWDESWTPTVHFHRTWISHEHATPLIRLALSVGPNREVSPTFSCDDVNKTSFRKVVFYILFSLNVTIYV
jgi:hypothetical protein